MIGLHNLPRQSSAFDFFAFCLAIGDYKARQAGQ
jgi:hypothetical protein